MKFWIKNWSEYNSNIPKTIKGIAIKEDLDTKVSGDDGIEYAKYIEINTLEELLEITRFSDSHHDFGGIITTSNAEGIIDFVEENKEKINTPVIIIIDDHLW